MQIKLLLYFVNFSPKHVEVQGMKLKQGVAVITSTMDNTDLRFAKVEELFIVNDTVVLGLHPLKVLKYSNHYHSWIVEHEHTSLVLYMKDLPSRQVLTLRPVRGTYWKYFFLTLKYAV